MVSISEDMNAAKAEVISTLVTFAVNELLSITYDDVLDREIIIMPSKLWDTKMYFNNGKTLREAYIEAYPNDEEDESVVTILNYVVDHPYSEVVNKCKGDKK